MMGIVLIDRFSFAAGAANFTLWFFHVNYMTNYFLQSNRNLGSFTLQSGDSHPQKIHRMGNEGVFSNGIKRSLGVRPASLHGKTLAQLFAG